MEVMVFFAVLGALWPSGHKGRGRLVSTKRVRPKARSAGDRVFYLFVPLGIVILAFDPFFGVVLIATGPAALWFRARSHTEAGKRALREALPETTDLLSIALGSGSSVAGAIQLVATEGPVPVRPAFRSVLVEAMSGEPLMRTLPRLSDSLGEEFQSLATALTSSVRDGAPLGQLLLRLGDNARLSRRRRAEERARRLSVAIMFPLAFCSMPAVLIGTVVPIVIVGFRSTPF